jgi:hypothetical protein
MSVNRKSGPSQEGAVVPARRVASAPIDGDARPGACGYSAGGDGPPCSAAPVPRSAGGVRAMRAPPLPSPLLPEAAARQNIASYAHLHGVVLTRKHAPVDAMAPATLCRILREAIEATTEGRRERAEMVVRSIAARIGHADGEPLAVPQVALDVLRRLTLAARLAGGTPQRSSAPAVRASRLHHEKASGPRAQEGGHPVRGRPTKPARPAADHKGATRKRAKDHGVPRSWP